MFLTQRTMHRAGTEHTTLASESRKLYHFIKGGDGETPQWKKEQMFVQMLEGLHESESCTSSKCKR